MVGLGAVFNLLSSRQRQTVCCSKGSRTQEQSDTSLGPAEPGGHEMQLHWPGQVSLAPFFKCIPQLRSTPLRKTEKIKDFLPTPLPGRTHRMDGKKISLNRFCCNFTSMLIISNSSKKNQFSFSLIESYFSSGYRQGKCWKVANSSSKELAQDVLKSTFFGPNSDGKFLCKIRRHHLEGICLCTISFALSCSKHYPS